MNGRPQVSPEAAAAHDECSDPIARGEQSFKRPFIPLWMEQAELTTVQYRILGHLWSRGEGRCFPSLETIAKACGVKRITAIRAISDLESKGLISRRKRKTKGVRFANEYILTGPIGAPVKSQPVPLGHRLTGPIGAPANRSLSGTGNDTSVNDTPLNDSLGQNDFAFLPCETTQSTAETIYSLYPRKVAKKPALKAINSALKKNEGTFLIERTKLFAQLSAGKEKRYIPHPATWYGQERFNDDPDEWKQPAHANQPPTHQVNTSTRTRGPETIIEA